MLRRSGIKAQQLVQMVQAPKTCQAQASVEFKRGITLLFCGAFEFRFSEVQT